MTSQPELTEQQAYWLRRVLESRPKRDRVLDRVAVPAPIQDALVSLGLIRWHRGLVEITIEGIRAVARHPAFCDPEGNVDT